MNKKAEMFIGTRMENANEINKGKNKDLAELLDKYIDKKRLLADQIIFSSLPDKKQENLKGKREVYKEVIIDLSKIILEK